MATVRGAAITIACTDLARSVAFYEEALGAVREPRDGYGCPWFNLGPLPINLLPNATKPSPAKFPDHPMAMLWLEVDDLGAVAERLSRLGIAALSPFDGQSMTVADPDGIVIELWQAEAE